MPRKGVFGRFKRVAGQLLGALRPLTVAEVTTALGQTIEVIRSEDYDSSVKRLFRRAHHRNEFDELVDEELCRNPGQGDTIANTSGCRKMRVARPDQQRGERGGARVTYLYNDQFRCAYLMFAYAKNEADDISEAGKKVLRGLSAEFDKYLRTRD